MSTTCFHLNARPKPYWLISWNWKVVSAYIFLEKDQVREAFLPRQGLWSCVSPSVVKPWLDHILIRKAPKSSALEEASTSAQTLFQARTGLVAHSKRQVMLLLLLLLWPPGVCISLKAKCLLTQKKDGVNPKNHYRPGEFFIDGIYSATRAKFHLLSFNTTPLNEFLW